MGMNDLRSAMPEYARDLRLNLGSVMSASSLEPVMAWGSALTAALVSKNAQVIQHIAEDAQAHLDEIQMKAAKSAAAMMSMTNVWYKFTDLIQDDEVKKQPPKLRMNAMLTHGGVDHALFEAWSLSASVVNACGVCVNAHASQLNKLGIDAQQVADIARIAAVVKAVSDTLSFEASVH
jgi:alkyl hydroperoxide reductase subunit D